MPCARCIHMRKKCKPDCEFARFFPAKKYQKFRHIQLVFGADNFMNMLKAIPADKQGEAVESMAYEAEMRRRNPVNGCFGRIKALEQEVEMLKRKMASLSDKAKTLQAAQSKPNPPLASPSRKPVAPQAAHGLPKQMPPSL